MPKYQKSSFWSTPNLNYEKASRKLELSSPGEFHPQALPEPDVTVSRHPARITPTAGLKPNGLALPLGSSHLWLTKQ